MKKFAVILLPLLVSGCLLESVGPIDRSIKPYGAHWIKDGMTRDSRRHDFKECGGDSVSFKAGYEKQRDQTTADYFEGLNKHTLKVHSCMRAKDYIYLEQCDARCLYP
jgi:hypothetical protein